MQLLPSSVQLITVTHHCNRVQVMSVLWLLVPANVLPMVSSFLLVLATADRYRVVSP